MQVLIVSGADDLNFAPAPLAKKNFGKFFFANGAGERDFGLEGGLPSSAERFIRGVVLLRNPIPALRAGTTLVANGNSDQIDEKMWNLKLLALRHSTLEGLAPDR